MMADEDKREAAEQAASAAAYYRQLIAEGVPSADAVKMTASWIGSQVIAEMAAEDAKEPWQK